MFALGRPSHPSKDDLPMRHGFLLLIPAIGLVWSSASDSQATIVFSTNSTATQTLTSPLFGGAKQITATGTQTFTLDLVAHTANVISLFKGSDLPNPAGEGTLSYDLYNTVTSGTVQVNGSGHYDVTLSLLFELKITTPGALFGTLFETLKKATFTATDIPSLPFPPGTAFFDPAFPDTIPIYLSTDLVNPVGTSSNRVVTINSIVPEPSTIASAGLALLATAGAFVRRDRKASRSN